MSKELKQLMAAEVREELNGSPNLLVIGLRPMSSETNYALRCRIREQNAHLRVVQNRTSRYALDEARKELSPLFVGQTAVAVSEDPEADFISVAKALVEAARKKSVELRGGYIDGEVLDKAGFEALANSPDKPTLRAMLCGAILGPARGIAVSMQAVGGGIARCIQARIDDSGEAGGDS